MKSIIRCLLILLVITSCSNYFENGYHRVGRESTYFQKAYKPINSVKINSIRICKNQKQIVKKKLVTKGEINITSHNIEKNIVTSLKKKFKYVDYEPENNTSLNQNCDYLKRGSLLTNYYKSNLNESKGLSIDITFNIEYNSTKNYASDANFGITTYDNDKHSIKYLLRLAIIDGNELAYIDNYGYRKTIISNRDEKIDYEVPKSVIDTLVTKSLTEYYKRMK